MEKGPIYSFYDDYEKKEPFVRFFYMLITGGLYLIWWIYVLNMKFEQKGIDAPESTRGLVVLITFPFLIGFFFYFLETIFEPNAILKSFQYSVSYFVIVLQLKFLYDFSVTFGNVTNTNPLIWYYSMFCWFLAVVLLYFGSFFTLIFMFFPISAIPAMQAFLNERYEKFRLKESSEKFNFKVRRATY